MGNWTSLDLVLVIGSAFSFTPPLEYMGPPNGVHH
jgi:hypothetical protein